MWAKKELESSKRFLGSSPSSSSTTIHSESPVSGLTRSWKARLGPGEEAEPLLLLMDRYRGRDRVTGLPLGMRREERRVEWGIDEGLMRPRRELGIERARVLGRRRWGLGF